MRGANYHAGFFPGVEQRPVSGAGGWRRSRTVSWGCARWRRCMTAGPFTSGLAGAFVDAFEALGGTVTHVAEVSRDTTDMVSVLTRVAADGPEGLVFTLFPEEAGQVVRQVGGVAGMEGAALITSVSVMFAELESVDAYLARV